MDSPFQCRCARIARLLRVHLYVQLVLVSLQGVLSLQAWAHPRGKRLDW